MPKTTLKKTLIVNNLNKSMIKLESVETYYLSEEIILSPLNTQILFKIQHGIDSISDTLKFIAEVTKK